MLKAQTDRSVCSPEGRDIVNLKDRIIQESIKLFSDKGFLNTPITDIMEASGTSKGGLYNHFPNKEELCLAVLSESRRIWREINLAGLEEIDSPLGKIRRILENYRDRYLPGSGDVPGGCIFVRVSVESAALAAQWPRLAGEVSDGFRRFRSMVKRYLDHARMVGEIRTGVDTEEVADMIFSSMMGASVIYSMDRSVAELDRNIGSIIRYMDSKMTGVREEAS